MKPTLVGTLRVFSTDGYSGFQIQPTDGYAEPVTLYVWSDGIVTWTEDRHDAA